jgi:hypothetical protein
MAMGPILSGIFELVSAVKSLKGKEGQGRTHRSFAATGPAAVEGLAP